MNKQLVLTFGNIAFFDLFKSNSKELLGTSLKELLSPECVPGNIEQFKSLFRDEIEQFNLTNTYIDCQKKLFRANIQISKFPSQQGVSQESFICFFNVIYDIDTKNSLQEKIDRKNRELLTNIIFISQRNTLLNSIVGSLNNVAVELKEPKLKKEILEVINHIKRNIQLGENWEKFNVHFEKVHPGFFTKLHKLAPQLTQKELKQCAYIRLGLNYKETALLLGISVKGIEMARYRIKKKLLSHDSDQSLGHFIRNL